MEGACFYLCNGSHHLSNFPYCHAHYARNKSILNGDCVSFFRIVTLCAMAIYDEKKKIIN